MFFCVCVANTICLSIIFFVAANIELLLNSLNNNIIVNSIHAHTVREMKQLKKNLSY